VRREVNPGDTAFRALTATFATVTMVVLVIVACALAYASKDTISAYGFGFLTGKEWNPVEGSESFGALPFIYGTLVTSLLALLIAVPISLGIAIFLAELAPERVRGPLSFLVELLAAVPSVIYGLWGFFVLRPVMIETVEPALGKTFGFLPFFKGAPFGTDVLLASIVLAIMILPTISSVSREVLRAVPNVIREGALALGATRWEMIRTVVLPYAKSGISGAIILGLGRALGETMAVTMLIGNKPQIKASLFEPASTLASVIANQYPEAHGLQLSALTELGLILFVLTLLLNMVARLLVWRVGRLPSFKAQ
jgi:phosphate transport system permease protein